MKRIVSLREQIRKFFFEKHLDFLTSVPQRRMQEIILASCAKGNSGKMTNYAEVFPVHRTTYGHFLSKGKWDDETILEYYSHRWKIEVLFRSHKRYMGFKGFMVRAAKAFDRLLTILCVAHFFFTCGLGTYMSLEVSIRSCRASLGSV